VRKLVLAAALAGLGITISGCGGAGAPSVANLGTTTTNATTTVANSNDTSTAGSSQPSSGGKAGVPFSVQGSVQQMMKFAACIRANGEPSFPNPNAQGVVSAGFNRASPQFDRALQACRKDLPGGVPTPTQEERDLRRAVAFSACMRQNGEPDYPDPVVGTEGGTAIHLLNIDQNSPQFERAQAVCKKRVPGSGKG
jgi:hypothetical protein